MASVGILRDQILKAVDTQISSGKPQVVRRTLERLMADGFPEEEARLLIARAFSVEMYECSTESREPDPERYASLLENLPNLPVDSEPAYDFW